VLAERVGEHVTAGEGACRIEFPPSSAQQVGDVLDVELTATRGIEARVIHDGGNAGAH
jgi:hypothetical protein